VGQALQQLASGMHIPPAHGFICDGQSPLHCWVFGTHAFPHGRAFPLQLATTH
jgi:hypothetical protein